MIGTENDYLEIIIQIFNNPDAIFTKGHITLIPFIRKEQMQRIKKVNTILEKQAKDTNVQFETEKI